MGLWGGLDPPAKALDATHTAADRSLSEVCPFSATVRGPYKAYIDYYVSLRFQLIAIGGIYSHVRTIHTVHLIPYTNISQNWLTSEQ